MVVPLIQIIFTHNTMKGLGHEFINEDKLLTEEQVSYDDGGDL